MAHLVSMVSGFEMFNMIIRMLRIDYESALYRATKKCLKQLERRDYSVGRTLNCNFSTSASDKFSFTSSLITSDPHLGDVNGVYHYYQSRKFKTLTDALASLTRQAIVMDNKLSELTVVRSFYFAKTDDVENFYQGFKDEKTKTEFIESRAGHNVVNNKLGVLEKFVQGQWVVSYSNEIEDRLNYLENRVETIK